MLSRKDYNGFELEWPLAKLGSGRSYAAAGDKANACKAYDEFFAVWKDADRDIPILKQAEREYARLSDSVVR